MLLKDDLFKLVKAMSKSEKRYFSLDAQKSGKKGSRYLDVFRFLSDMDEFDDERLKKKFPKNLSSDKSYLYDAILRSMRDYRSTKSKAAQIKEKIQDSRYLFERGLYKQCDSRLQEANDIAKELGDELMILEVARERLLTIKGNRDKHFAERVEELLIDGGNALKNVNNFFKYSDAYYETIVKVTKNFYLPTEERAQISLPDFFEKEKDILKSPQTERRYLQSQALYYQLRGDSKNVLKYFGKTAEWWDRNIAFKEEEYFRYITDVCNMIYAFIANEKFDEAEKYIEFLKKDEPSHRHEKRIWLESLYLYQLMLLLNQKDYKKANELLGEIDNGIVKYGLTNNYILSCNIGILYFLIGDYVKCRDWLEDIINAPKTGLRTDVQVLVRILNLVSLYEGDEVEKLENAIRSVSRFFKKNNIPKDSFESDVLQVLTIFFRNSPFENSSTKSDLQQLLDENLKKSGSRDYIVEPLQLWLSPVVTF